MPDPRFFAVAGPFSLAEIAEAVGATLAAGADPARRVSDVAPLGKATSQHLSFFGNRKYVDAFAACQAGACIAPASLAHRAPADVAVLTSEAPYKSYALAAALFYPVAAPVPGVHPAAVVDPAAVLGDGCRVEAGAVIAADARIGTRLPNRGQRRDRAGRRDRRRHADRCRRLAQPLPDWRARVDLSRRANRPGGVWASRSIRTVT